MKKKLVFCVLLIAIVMTSVFGFVGCDKKTDWEKIEKSGKVVVGITYYEPMNYFDANNELTGFETEFAKAVFNKLGVTPQFQEIQWDQKIAELKSGNIDCVWNGMTALDELKEGMDFSSMYFVNKQVAVVNKVNKDKYPTKESLKDANITAEKSSAGESVANEIGCTKYNAAPSQAKALMELKSGNVDVAIIDFTMALGTIEGDKVNAYSDLVILETPIAAEEKFAVGFRKGSDLAAKVNGAIKELMADGTVDKIAKKYNLEKALIK